MDKPNSWFEHLTGMESNADTNFYRLPLVTMSCKINLKNNLASLTHNIYRFKTVFSEILKYLSKYGFYGGSKMTLFSILKLVLPCKIIAITAEIRSPFVQPTLIVD